MTAGKPSVVWQVSVPGHFAERATVAGGEVITVGNTRDCVTLRRVAFATGAVRSSSRCPVGEAVSSVIVAATPHGDAITAANQVTDATTGTLRPVVAKHDRDSGTVAWEKRFAVGQSAIAVAADARGDVLVSLAAGSQSRIAKLSGVDGTVLWESVETGYVRTIRGDGDRNAFVASAGYGDGWVRKYSPDGAVLWTRRIGDGSSSLFPNDLQLDSSGNAFVTGGMAADPGRFDRAFTTMKLSAADGSTLWSNVMDLVGRDDVGLSVAVMEGGEAVATGHSDGMMTTIRYSGGGQLVSKAVHPRAVGSSDDRGFDVRALPGGDAVVSGWVRRDSVQDVRVVRYARDGTPVWSTPYRYARYGREFPVDIVPGPDGAILVSTSSGDGGAAPAGTSFVKLSLAARPGNHQGLWWRAPAGSAPGWGLNLAHQGDVIFGAWFTYGLDMQPDWYFMPAMENISLDDYEGDIYHATGPAFDSPTFDSSQVRLGNYGPARLEFSSDGAARFALLGDGAPPAESVVPYLFSATQPTCAAGTRAAASQNFQDLWWADPPGSQSGWGVFLAHQGDSIFLTWFTYGAGGKAMWYFASDVRKTGTRAYRGALYRASGPTFRSDPWPAVQTIQVGETSLDFDDADHGLFRYSVDGITGAKRITRNAFAAPATVCQ